MKNLKIGLLFAIAALVGFTSCEQNEFGPENDTLGISEVLDMVFLATTDDSTTTDRKHKCKLTEIELTELPATITTYIDENYEGSTLVRAGVNDEDGSFGVLIENAEGQKVGLKFDAEGNFVAERVRKSKGERVAVEDLPTAVTDYITENYPDAEIKGARLFEDGSIGVGIKLSDNGKLGLGFDAEGNFTGELEMKGKKRRR